MDDTVICTDLDRPRSQLCKGFDFTSIYLVAKERDIQHLCRQDRSIRQDFFAGSSDDILPP